MPIINETINQTINATVNGTIPNYVNPTGILGTAANIADKADKALLKGGQMIWPNDPILAIVIVVMLIYLIFMRD